MASIQGPAAATQSGSPPTFQVDPTPNEVYAYELATQPQLFDSERHGDERRTDNFFASWQNAPFMVARSFRAPDEAWNQLRRANRLYYRVWTSASRHQWQNALTTTPNEEAASAPFVQLVRLVHGGVLNETQVPVAEIWSTAVAQEVIRSLTAAAECQVVLCWHMFSPKRPIDPRAGEWVVAVTTLLSQSDGPIQIGLARLAVQPLTVKAVQTWQGSPTPLNRNEAVERLSVTKWRLDVEQFQRAGEFWIASELRPPPGASGGTAIFHAETGQVLYQATTEWQGAGAVLIPPTS